MTKYIAKKPDQHGHIHFTQQEDETWQILFDRQMQTIQGRACDEFIVGLKSLDLPRDRVPQCPDVSRTLAKLTNWSVVPVDAIIPLEVFFDLLANRQFPAASFIRVREELDYLQEPDIFHEIFGHCPMLTWQPYADFIERFAKAALCANPAALSLLGRLFWFTIEFGLINTHAGLRVYGAGIISSHAETHFALESHEPMRLPFDAYQTLKTDYRYDIIQKLYFTIDSFSQLFAIDVNEMVRVANQLSENPMSENDFVIC